MIFIPPNSSISQGNCAYSFQSTREILQSDLGHVPTFRLRFTYSKPRAFVYVIGNCFSNNIDLLSVSEDAGEPG